MTLHLEFTSGANPYVYFGWNRTEEEQKKDINKILKNYKKKYAVDTWEDSKGSLCGRVYDRENNELDIGLRLRQNLKEHKYYIAVNVEDENNKYYAYVMQVNCGDNIHDLSSGMDGVRVKVAYIMPKKDAMDMVALWNIDAKEHGRYMFDDNDDNIQFN